MNLIRDAWIPVRRRSGTTERISPWQITEGVGEDTIIGLASPRPDFSGALIQFLIGLLQTTCAPETPRQWRQWLQQPPGPEELQSAFEPVAYAFELHGDGPRFMQDLTLEDEVETLQPRKQMERKKAVYELLIDAPTGKTLDDNTDHFIKRGVVEKLCLGCVAMALFALQTNAPLGGQGHRTGLRGGGPMTTLVVADTLWMTCWLNVIEQQVFRNLANSDKDKDSDRFPWLAPTRTSEADKVTTSEDVHPDQIFWSMPRRLHLIVLSGREDITCDLCGMHSDQAVRHFFTKNFGVNYAGPWRHSLSPYFIDKAGIPSAIHPQPGGIGYRHWLGLVQASQDNKGKRQPAIVIEQFVQRRPADLRLWAFGYDMDNMKARCWYDSAMPLILAKDTIRESYEFHTAALVNSAQYVSRQTRAQVKKALFRPGHNVRGDLSFIEFRFWQETEADFFDSLNKLRDTLDKGHDVAPNMESWHKRLARTAEAIFNDASQTGAFDAADPKRIALAWRDLRRSIHSKKLREQLGLPAKEARPSKT